MAYTEHTGHEVGTQGVSERRAFWRSRSAWRLAAVLAAACSLTAPAVTGCSGRGDDGGAEGRLNGFTGGAVVISQVYGGAGSQVGGKFGRYNRDYIELFNRSPKPVSLGGWSLQFAKKAAALGADDLTVPLPDVTLPPGGYYLIAFRGAEQGEDIPKPDFEDDYNIAFKEGKIALVRGTTPLECGAAGSDRCASEDIVDFVGYGGANDFEGEEPVAPLDAQAASRKENGCQDTDTNGADFEVPAAREPRNSASDAHSCGFGEASEEDAGEADDASTDEDAGEKEPEEDGGEPVARDAGPEMDAAQPEPEPVDPEAGKGLVISQIFGGGGQNGSPLQQDYVELFNRSKTPVSLKGLSIQYGSAAGDFGRVFPDGANFLALKDAEVGPGKYFLVGLAKGEGGNGQPLPAVDQEASIEVSARGGKVALARGATSLGCGSTDRPCPAARLIDLVAFGAATPFEGKAAAPELNNEKAAVRKGAGCQDTDDNGDDFLASAPGPRNGAEESVNCDAPPPDPEGESGSDGGPKKSPRPDDEDEGDDMSAGPQRRSIDAGKGVQVINNGDAGGGCSTAPAGLPASGAAAALGAVLALGVALGARRRNAR